MSVEDAWYRLDRTTGRKVATQRHGRGKRWRVRVRGAATKSFDRKVDAERHDANARADVLRGVYVDYSRSGAVTVRDYGQRWLAAQVHLRANTRETYATHLRTHVYPALGGRMIGQVRRTDMKAFVSALSAQLAPATVETVYAVLRALMQSAVDDDVIPANPCARVPLPRVERRVVEPLPAGAVLELVDAMTPRYRLAVWLGAGAGLREGEALGLTVGRVDFLRRRVVVEEQAQNGVLAPLKTKASRRTVPVDDVVVAEIAAHMRRWVPHDDTRVLVTNRSRRHVRRSSFGTCWRSAVKAAELPTGTRFHDLRHFYASTLIDVGLHPKAIQARLGHATIAETMDTYGHLFPDSEDQGRGAIDTALRGTGERRASGS